MLPLPQGEIVQMRAEVNATLAGTAVLQSKTATSDGQGGYSWAYAASGTVDARLAPVAQGTTEEAFAGRLGIVDPSVLTIPANTTIDETYRVVWAGDTFEVRGLLPRVPWEISRRVLVEEVR